MGRLTLCPTTAAHGRHSPARQVPMSLERSVHEVFIEPEQMRWFEAKLEEAAAAGKPVAVFTHAPIAGSGLRAVLSVSSSVQFAASAGCGQRAYSCYELQAL